MISNPANPWKRLRTRVVYKNPWLQLDEDQVIRPDGKRGIYSVVRMRPCVAIIAVDANEHISFVGQWRYTINKFSWEIPSGGREKDESETQAAQRELLEETQLSAGLWKRTGFFYLANGMVDQKVWLFVARDLKTLSPSGKGDPTEQLTNTKKSREEIESMIQQNELTDDLTLAALHMFFLKNHDK